jgi:CRP-like cAMP-binding protein
MARFSQEAKVEALARAPLFEGLSKKELGQLARTTEDLEVATATVLCKEGQLGSEFFVIVDGEADVTKGGTYLATLGAGDFFGEIALVKRSRRTATVTAKRPLRFFVLSSAAFWGLLDHAPAVERKVLRTLAQRVYETAEATKTAG